MEENKIKTDLVIAQTRKWIADVVVACNFCPFGYFCLAAHCNHLAVYYGPLPCPDISHHGDGCLANFTFDVKISTDHNYSIQDFSFDPGRAADDDHSFSSFTFF